MGVRPLIETKPKFQNFNQVLTLLRCVLNLLGNKNMGKGGILRNLRANWQNQSLYLGMMTQAFQQGRNNFFLNSCLNQKNIDLASRKMFIYVVQTRRFSGCALLCTRHFIPGFSCPDFFMLCFFIPSFSYPNFSYPHFFIPRFFIQSSLD